MFDFYVIKIAFLVSLRSENSRYNICISLKGRSIESYLFNINKTDFSTVI